MRARDAKTVATIGFLTVVEHSPHGLFGGYLILNLAGRPVEFHCTAPVKPNRAQEILYGPTLEPFLYGEHIGQTLIGKGQTRPLAVITDLPAVLAARDHVELPVVLVLPTNESAPVTDLQSSEHPGRALRIDGPEESRELHGFHLGRNRLAVARSHSRDQQLLVAELKTAAELLDFAEPFSRIRGAIDEAQRGAR